MNSGEYDIKLHEGVKPFSVAALRCIAYCVVTAAHATQCLDTQAT